MKKFLSFQMFRSSSIHLYRLFSTIADLGTKIKRSNDAKQFQKAIDLFEEYPNDKPLSELGIKIKD